MFERLVCLVRRQHDYRLREGGGCVYLHCRRCGVRTPGFEASPRVRVRPTQPPPLRLLLADVEQPPLADVPLRLLLADTEPQTVADLSPRLLLSDARPSGRFEPGPRAELSVGSDRSPRDFRLGLE